MVDTLDRLAEQAAEPEHLEPVAARLTGLRDPADMLIVATALHHGAPLVTSDGRIADSRLVQVIA